MNTPVTKTLKFNIGGAIVNPNKFVQVVYTVQKQFRNRSLCML